jgi:hypothetical protein
MGEGEVGLGGRDEMGSVDLCHEIQTATTKSERFNKFVQWVSFGVSTTSCKSAERRGSKAVGLMS